MKGFSGGAGSQFVRRASGGGVREIQMSSDPSLARQRCCPVADRVTVDRIGGEELAVGGQASYSVIDQKASTGGRALAAKCT